MQNQFLLFFIIEFFMRVDRGADILQFQAQLWSIYFLDRVLSHFVYGYPPQIEDIFHKKIALVFTLTQLFLLSCSPRGLFLISELQFLKELANWKNEQTFTK